MSKALTFTAVAAAAFVGYAVYFDYNRRNSSEFRKALKAKNLKHKKQEEKAKVASKRNKVDEVKQALAQLDELLLPTDLSEKESYFMQQVSLGEQLANDPSQKIEAALCFYKALAVYPNPTDILGIYQRTIPEDVYELIVMMIAVKPPASVASVIGESAKPEPVAEVDLD